MKKKVSFECKCWVFYQVISSAPQPFFNLKCWIKKKKCREERERKHFRQPKNTLQTLWKMLPILFPLVAEPIFCIKISIVVNKHVFSSPLEPFRDIKWYLRNVSFSMTEHFDNVRG